MAVTKANTLSDQQLQVLLTRVVERAKRPLVDKVAFLLSYKAGLRVQEIAGLRWKENVLDADRRFRSEEVLVPGLAMISTVVMDALSPSNSVVMWVLR